MTTEQTASTPDQSNNQENDIPSSSGSSGKLLFIAVIGCILAIIIFQISKDKEPSSSKETGQAETVITQQPSQSQERVAAMQKGEPSAKEAATSDDSMTLTKDTQASLDLFLADWKKAWEKSAGSNDNLTKYFSFYADTFHSGSQDKKAWQHSKTIRNQGKSWIELWISDIKIKQASEKEQYTITFVQEYSSSNYSDKSTKMLTVAKEGSGYKIIEEKTL